MREIIKSSGALTQEALIGQLNPVLKGWAQYHSPVVAKQTFSRLDHLIFWRIWMWAKRRHPRKSADWIRTQQPPTEVGGLVTYGLKVRIRVD